MFNNPGDVIGVIYANQNQNQKNSDTKKRYRSQRSGQSATEIMGNARFVDFSLVHAGTKNDDISLSAASTLIIIIIFVSVSCCPSFTFIKHAHVFGELSHTID